MADTDLSGAVLDGRYKVIEPIAEGAMGSVYRAERVGLGRAVAIKVMHQELPDELASRQRFEREAKLMALLEHPNCVSVNDFGVHDDKPFLVMDLVRGTSLLDLLDKVRQLEVGRAADVIRQVLSGLAHAHELGIVHRDIKPANIMISEKAGLGEQVRILDFGLARLQESTAAKLTTGIVVGTPNYMAPEQCKGSDIDARTDVYACGVILFEMLTGRKPFVADDPIAVVRKQMLEKPPTMASVEPRIDFGDLEAVVAKALAKAPADRFDSAVAMSKAVEAAAAKQTKTSAAALFARAVPENPELPANNPQATMSGWNVPSGAQSTAIPSSVIPGVSSSSGPTGGVANVGDAASGPFTGVATVDAGSGASGPSASVGFGGADAGSGAGAASPASGSPPPSGLPPLPQAKPYVPPPGIGASAVPSIGGAPHGFDSGGTPNAPAITPGSGGASAAPNAPLEVPPTRPTPMPGSMRAPGAERPIPQLPFTKKQLMIGAGGLLGLIILIALVAGGGGDKKPSTKKVSSGSGSGSAIKDAPPPVGESVAATIEQAKALIASEDYDGAVGILKTARKAHPENAELAFLAGKAYFGQLWWADGVDSFRDALTLDASYKQNPELLKAVLKGFLTTPDLDDRIVGFMRHDIGLPLRPYLEETAEKHPKKNLRARARAELDAGR